MPINGVSQSDCPLVKMLSMNTLENSGCTMPTTVTNTVVMKTKMMADLVPRSRFLAKFITLCFSPPASKSSFFSNMITTPVNAWSNSFMETVTRPLAGSLMTAPFFVKPHRTTK